MSKIFGVAAIVFLLSLSSLPDSNSFYVFSSSSCGPCVARLSVVKELYPAATFVTYDIADTVSLSRFS
jgi:hypothetical protein